MNVKYFLDNYYDKAIELKKNFKITEDKNWNAITVLGEMNTQLGHFCLLMSEHKEYKEVGRNIHDIGDELSDIVLQIVALAWKLKLNLKEYEYNYKKVEFSSINDAILSFNVVYGQVSEIILEKYKYRHYKIRYEFSKVNDFILYKLANMLEIIFNIANVLNVNMAHEFDLMLNDANKFLDRFAKVKEAKFYPIVDVHATWMVLNPVQGCPKQCKYCFLRERKLNLVQPKVLASPENAVKLLLKSKFYIKDIPLCLLSQTDGFSIPDNIEYLKQLVTILMEKNVENPIVFITKCKIPEDFIKFIDNYEKQGKKFIFFLSYSGFDKDIEVGVNRKDIENNFITLHKYNKTIIHYWRPFMPSNSRKEDINRIYNFVKKYAVASVAIGLKITDEIMDHIEWNELRNHRKEALKADNVWDKNAYEYVWKHLKDESDYPIYQTTSCALAVALSKPDRKFFYNSDICKCNKCSNYQRNLCKKKNDNLKMVSKNDVKKLIKKLGKEIDLKDIELKDNMIILRNIILSLNEISYITEILQHQVLVMKKEDDYYWNTSINNSSILKV